MSFFSDKLIKNLEKELKAKPSSKCFSVLAQIHYGQGDFKKAEKLCLDGLKYHPSHIPALLLLAEIYISLEKKDQASSYLNLAQVLAPDHPKIYEKLARLYTKQNQLEKTIEAYKTLLVLMPEHPTALDMLSYLEPFEKDPLATDTASGLEEPPGRVKDKSLKQSGLKKQKLLKLNQMLARVENYIEKSGI